MSVARPPREDRPTPPKPGKNGEKRVRVVPVQAAEAIGQAPEDILAAEGYEIDPGSFKKVGGRVASFEMVCPRDKHDQLYKQRNHQAAAADAPRLRLDAKGASVDVGRDVRSASADEAQALVGSDDVDDGQAGAYIGD